MFCSVYFFEFLMLFETKERLYGMPILYFLALYSTLNNSLRSTLDDYLSFFLPLAFIDLRIYCHMYHSDQNLGSDW
jgi:hypothetical protein